jgi:hypothetical protein
MIELPFTSDPDEPTTPDRSAAASPRGDGAAPLSNGGPPLDDDAPPWGRDGIGNYFDWKAAKKKAFDAPYAIAMLRVRRADELGLTYEEYTLEILERGRHLGPGDTERIAEIKRKRPIRY